MVAAERAGVAQVVEMGPGRLVLDQLDRAEEAVAANLADDRVVGQAPEPLGQVGPGLVADLRDQAFLLDDAQVLQGDGAGHGMAGVGEAVEELAAFLDQGLGDPLADHDRGERQVAGGDALGQGHEVGPDVEELAGEPGARAPEARDHLVGDQQHVVLLADPLDLRPVGLGRDDHPAGALDRLADEGGDGLGPQLQDLVLDRLGRLAAEVLGRERAAVVVPIGRGDVDEAGQGQVGLAVHRGHAAQAGRRHGAAVVAEGPRDEGLLLGLALQVPEVPDHAHDGVVGLGAGGGEEDPVEPRRGDLGELLGQLDRGRRRRLEEGVVVGQLEHLLVGDLGQLLAAVADVDAPQPGHGVQDAVALGIGEVDAFGRGDDPAAALLGQGLGVGEGVQVVAAVGFAPPGCGVACGLGCHLFVS